MVYSSLSPLTQQRDLDGFGARAVAPGILGQHLADMEMHLQAFVLGQAADIAAVAGQEQVQAALQIIEHRLVEPRGEELITALSIRRGRWARASKVAALPQEKDSTWFARKCSINSRSISASSSLRIGRSCAFDWPA